MEGKKDIRPFYRAYSNDSQDFGLTEFLHDICIARIGTVAANIHDTNLDTIKRVLWQVESEFSSNTREAVKDFNKLVAGSGENKLFIGPYRGLIPRHRLATQLPGIEKFFGACLLTSTQGMTRTGIWELFHIRNDGKAMKQVK